MAERTREDLLALVIEASGESSTLAVFFHGAIAERAGLGPTDTKTLFLLSRVGKLTAGEIAQQTGLTTASVTNLIDRLERKGFVNRVRDASDRRRIIVALNHERMAEFAGVFAAFQDGFRSFLAAYTDEQLATIADFLARAAQHTRAAVDLLGQTDPLPNA